MLQRKDVAWIGFEEAQKSINALKQEVDVAEKKILAAKRTIYKKNPKEFVLTPKTIPENQTNYNTTPSKLTCKAIRIFKKGNHAKISKTTCVKKEELTVSKKISALNSQDEDEPNFVPTKLYSTPTNLKQTVAQNQYANILFQISSSEDLSTSDVKCSSSEGTASLIEGTFKEASKLLKSSQTQTSDISDYKCSMDIRNQDSNYETKVKSVNSESVKKLADEMEWKIVPQDKPFVKMKYLKPDGIQKLKDVIERQKKKQKMYEKELEKNILTESESSESLKYDQVKKPKQVIDTESHLESVPMRKVCVVKSLPVYKGFNAPSDKITFSKQWRTQKSKHSIGKEFPNMPRRIYKVVRSKSDTASYKKKLENVKSIRKQDDDANEIDNEYSNISSFTKSIKIESNNKTTINADELPKKISTSVEDKTYTDSFIVEDNGIKEDSLKDLNSSLMSSNMAQDELSNSFKITYTPKQNGEDKSGSKENKKPSLEVKSTKRKAKKPPEHPEPSPKIRHYDVDKIRNYIKKKKEERRKRHQEEYQKQLHFSQKKKENLEKLYEYHKQNMKSPTKIKPLSPIKLYHRKDKVTRKHENEHDHVENLTKIECKELSQLKIDENKNSNEKFIETPCVTDKKGLFQDENPTYTVSSLNNVENKKKQENVHIDITLSKFVSDQCANSALSNVPKVCSSSDAAAIPTSTVEKRDLENPDMCLDEYSPNKTEKSKCKDILKPTSTLIENDIEDSLRTLTGFESMSCISTPTEIRIANSEIEVKKIAGPSHQDAHSNKREILRDLVKSIDFMTKPLEPFLRTKMWVEDNPPPPRKSEIKVKKKNDMKHSNVKKSEFYTSKRSLEFQQKVAKSLSQKDSSFKEQVSGIGDVTELYAKILGKNSDLPEEEILENNSVPSHNNFNSAMVENNSKSLIEGSLSVEELHTHASEVESSHHKSSAHSSHFSDLLNQNINPDPFNLANTWKRKPLNLSLYGKEDGKTVFSSTPLGLSASGDAPLDENYQSDFTSSYISSFISEVTEIGAGDQVSDYSFQQKSGKMSLGSNASMCSTNVERKNKKNIENATSSYVSSHIYENHPKTKIKISNQSSQSIDVEKDRSSSPGEHTLNPFETHEANSVSDKYVDEDERVQTNANLQQNDSEFLLSGTIKSEYTLEDNLEESLKESGQRRASVSGSSISEVISVVENSKGFRSSAEDILSDQAIVSEHHSKTSLHASEKRNSLKSDSHEKDNTKSSIIETGSIKSMSLNSASTDKNVVALSLNGTSHVDEKSLDDSTILPTNDHLQNIAPNSPNSITIDFQQPLRFILSNPVDESAQSFHGIDVHAEPYLHTQIIKRITSEAASEAAKSAVNALFETQKNLMAENNCFGFFTPISKPSNNKKVLYSTDFESPSTTKTSSRSSHSSSRNKQKSESEDIIEELYSSEKSESGKKSSEVTLTKSRSSKTESIDENIPESKIDSDVSVSSKIPSVKTDENIASAFSEVSVNQSPRTPQRSKRKISGNLSSPSPASLSDNPSESVTSDESFAQLTLDVVRRMTQDEGLRAKKQLHLLELQENTLVEKARAEMMLLELTLKKLKKKGAENEVYYIKKKKKELILFLRQERAQLKCMKEAYRSICEKHRSWLKDRKLLSEPHSSNFQLLNKEGKASTSQISDKKELIKSKSLSTTPTGISDIDHKIMLDEDSLSEVPEVLKVIGSNSSQESVIETNMSEVIKTSNSSQNKSQHSTSNSPFSPVTAAQSNSNPSLHSNNSAELAAQGLKQLEASKRHLTKREQRLLYRRKLAESVLRWNMSLDSDEKEVKQLEQKAIELVNQSKRKTKYYVSSSASTNVEDTKKSESIQESKMLKQINVSSDISSAQTTNGNKSNPPQVTSDENIVASISENEVLEEIEIDKENSPVTTTEKSGSPTEIKTETSIHTLEASGNNSQLEEAISEEMSYQTSPSIKDKSSNSDVYSESFESSMSRKTSSAPSSSSPVRNSSTSRNIKRDKELKIRLPLIPRNVRRHDSSGSDDSYTISQSETASDQSDIEVRIHAFAEELKRLKVEAEKLKKEQKKKYREKLKEKELSLQKQIEAYNQYITKTKLELEQQIESAISPPQTTDTIVKPRIKWPRPEQVIDSRRVRKQTTLAENFSVEKKTAELSMVSSEISETAPTAVVKDNGKQVAKKLLPDASFKLDSSIANKEVKEVSEKSTSDSKEILEAKSISEADEILESNKAISSDLTSETKEISEISEKTEDVSSEIKNISETTMTDQNNKNSTASVISTLEESKSSHSNVDSKSQSDTFVSETSQNSDSSSVKHSENNLSETLADEQSAKISKESSESSDKVSDKTSSQEGMSEESVSEILSVVNSASVEEELESDISSHKSLKCTEGGGCGSPPKTKVPVNTSIPQESNEICEVGFKSNEKEISIHVDSDIVPDNKNKLAATDSQIVNIVNYLSSVLLDDTIKIFSDLSIQKYNQNNFLNIKLFKNKYSKKTVEEFSLSLFDKFLEDTLDSFIKIFKNYSKPVSISNTVKSDTLVDFKCGESQQTVEKQSFDVTYDNIENKIASKQVKWTEDSFISPLKDSQQLEQQLALQQYSYFYRKIPNKPPPPYTPPSSTQFDFPFLKAKPVEKIPTIKDVTKCLDNVIDNVVEVIVNGKNEGMNLNDISFSSVSSVAEKLDLNTPHQLIFMDLIFDLSKEIISENFNEQKPKDQPCVRPRKLTPKPLLPQRKEKLLPVLQNELKKALKIDQESSNKKTMTLWSSLKLGRKKRDFVDTILISELKEEEPDWVNYDQDEMTVKFQIADSIFNVLIDDTMRVIKDLQDKINR